MTDWFAIMRDIRSVREGLEKAPLEPPAVQTTLLRMLTIMHSITLAAEFQRQAPRSSPDELRIASLTNRVQLNETSQELGFSALDLQLKKRFDAIDAKLEAILARLPEPPHGFDG